jgi:hypothetical protein
MIVTVVPLSDVLSTLIVPRCASTRPREIAKPKAAEARFAFDTATVGEPIDLIERTLSELEAV